MEATVQRTQTAFRLNSDLIRKLKVEARKQNRSLNNYVETVLMDAVYRIPNETTLAAIEEAKSGKDLETLDLNNFEEFVKAL